MTSSLIVALLIASIAIAALLVLARHSRAANAPGLVENQLSICAQSSNCVCSEDRSTDASKVDPFSVFRSNSNSDDLTSSINWEQLTGVLVADGAKVVDQNDNYLAATYSSKFFGFIDDVELRFDPQTGLIHVRSASRTGKSDFGINRSRVERLRSKISLARLPNSTQ